MHFDNCAFHIFRNDWIDCRDAFHVVLCITLRNGLKVSEMANGFSTNNLLGMHQETIKVISLKKQTNKYL